jgi:hypothetical protein
MVDKNYGSDNFFISIGIQQQYILMMAEGLGKNM